ncbi:PadR family transcriptional regulator [Anabaena cylindrica UHCC 0172]|uniref:PadR family transcriptional regulator n=1 Tax=Anabaena cylindrica TaxID=1165 RepID=UPI002B218026|nr:PadR family transcriptional regulator [Anabaena cylindrica]MEA5550953.1 PadR family transcriptional regulator [Anabaena cylindrica UHCC 0172]
MSLSYAILSSLIEAPHSGYDLSKVFSESVGFFWHASQQQIYRELGKLETQDLIVSEIIPREGRLNKKIYSITELGKQHLVEWMRKPSEPDVIREDILVKIFSGSLVAINVLIEDVERRRRIHLDKLSKYREIEQKHFSQLETLTHPEKLKHIVLKAGIHCESEWIDWCNEALEMLKQSQMDDIVTCTIK